MKKWMRPNIKEILKWVEVFKCFLLWIISNILRIVFPPNVSLVIVLVQTVRNSLCSSCEWAHSEKLSGRCREVSGRNTPKFSRGAKPIYTHHMKLVHSLTEIQFQSFVILQTVVMEDCPTFITPTFITSDIHHLRHSSPQTFITPYLKSDIHHLGHSSPQTFITSDIHHLRRSSPQTFITPYLKSDIHHLRRSSPQNSSPPT